MITAVLVIVVAVLPHAMETRPCSARISRVGAAVSRAERPDVGRASMRWTADEPVGWAAEARQ